MNLLLVDAHEVAPDGTCVIADRRADHLREVLGATTGSTIRAGIVGGAAGPAEVIDARGDAFVLRLAPGGAPIAPWDVELVLAVPRPKVLSRAIETAAAFGVARVELTNAWRVDKSYLKSPRIEPAALAYAARLGAEQGATTHVAPIAVHARLMAMFEARASAHASAAVRLVAHPGGAPIETAVRSKGPVVLAIGAEGGWIEREVETFAARGFAPVSLGGAILRVEAAVAAALGQLALLQRL